MFAEIDLFTYSVDPYIVLTHQGAVSHLDPGEHRFEQLAINQEKKIVHIFFKNYEKIINV